METINTILMWSLGALVVFAVYFAVKFLAVLPTEEWGRRCREVLKQEFKKKGAN